MVDNEIIELHTALMQGKMWAASLQVGDTFTGCRPEANNRYPGSKIKASLFMDGALDVLLRTNIYVEDNGVITKIEREA